MSDTPMTDRRVIQQDPRMCGCCYKSEITYADFARRLERELAEVTKQRDELAKAIRKHKTTLVFMPDYCDVVLYNALEEIIE